MIISGLNLRQMKPLMSALECQCCSYWAVSWNLIGTISVAFLAHACLHETAAENAAVLPSLTHLGQPTVYCLQAVYDLCMVWPLSGSVSNWPTCVCVSRLVRLLSVSKFNLRQSASTVTKLRISLEGASCQSKKKRKKNCEQLCVHILNSHENPALRHNRDFNIATAQRPSEAMQVSIRINKICSSNTGLVPIKNA